MHSFAIFFIVLLLHQATGVIYRLNESEYFRMPPVFSTDNYELCMDDPDGHYCITNLALVSDVPSPLLDMIREYSEDTVKHYNHSRLMRGVCVTRSCKKFEGNSTADLKWTLEACQNESLWNDYQLKGKVEGDLTCGTAKNKTSNLTVGDYIVAIVCIGLFLFNVVGSLYDSISISSKSNTGYRLLKYFSLRHNWRRLVSPPADGPEPRLRRLKLFYGLRALTSALVIFAHSNLSYIVYSNNTHFVENMYYSLSTNLLLNGTVIVHSFFVMSSFLLSYNLELYAEKHNLNWIMLPKAFLIRWIRLTPPYAIVLALTCTWLGYTGSTPTWSIIVESMVKDCQRDWWYHILYINNYIDGSLCLQHTWYLAADTQLYILGVIVCVTCKTTRSRFVVLALMALAGLIVPALHIYFQDLDGTIILSPTLANNLLVTDPTFDNVYKRGHTKLFTYAVGLTLGFVVYHLQKINFDVSKYRRYRVLYWGMLPVVSGVIMLGKIFYDDGPRQPIAVRVLYGTLSKPVFAIALALGLGGMILKYENVYRSIVEWRGWTVPGRLAYCAYLVHLTLIKVVIGPQMTLANTSILQMMQQSFLMSLLSFAAAVPLWLLVESPFTQLLKFMVPKQELGKATPVANLEEKPACVPMEYQKTVVQ